MKGQGYFGSTSKDWHSRIATYLLAFGKLEHIFSKYFFRALINSGIVGQISLLFLLKLKAGKIFSQLIKETTGYLWQASPITRHAKFPPFLHAEHVPFPMFNCHPQ